MGSLDIVQVHLKLYGYGLVMESQNNEYHLDKSQFWDKFHMQQFK